ncbi:adenosylcobinamide-phosphate synthase CbiB [Pleurocapsa sp. FMAR1]|uniref:adenosylcobinamide-phosphate synthase CbiB n=1 Tax=Pleurocapsa sp. FMAR1 TaxID=3040204 RepID=UPI0029C7DF52|nr:adenosylcobinamide-phosphate synthase CbiB [Pleurocapsa sp. FMAR1]
MSIKLDLNQLEITVSAIFLVQSSPLILLLAAIEDYLIGDPWEWLHPVQIMGWLIKNYVDLAIKFAQPGWQRRFAGVLLGLILIIGSGLVGWLIIWGFSIIQPLLGSVVATVLLASCLAGKSLRVAVEDVLRSLDTQDLTVARSRLSLYVGRDTDNLSELEILRALLETIAENTVDGVTAPLFYAILGIFIPGVGAVPLALAYKAASTLDSMVGYRREPYSDLGWFSAQLEDRLTWFPCRLTVLTLSLFSGQPLKVLEICRRDGIKDPSPNSGWSEAVYAATLNVQLGGQNTYQGVVKNKPLLGNPLEAISVTKIDRALILTRYCFLVWLGIGTTLWFAMTMLNF